MHSSGARASSRRSRARSMRPLAGAAHFASISGEPGIGKSRLLVEFAAEQAPGYPRFTGASPGRPAALLSTGPGSRSCGPCCRGTTRARRCRNSRTWRRPIGELVPELVPAGPSQWRAARAGAGALSPHGRGVEPAAGVRGARAAGAGARRPARRGRRFAVAAGIRGAPVACVARARSSARFAMRKSSVRASATSSRACAAPPSSSRCAASIATKFANTSGWPPATGRSSRT